MSHQTAVVELGKYALRRDDPRAVGLEAHRKVNELVEPSFRAQMRWSAQPESPHGPDGGDVLRIRVTATSDLEHLAPTIR